MTKKRRGRPPKHKKKDEDETTSTNATRKHEITNETRMNNLDNPRLESVKNQPSFHIALPREMSSFDREAKSFFEQNLANDPSIEATNVEEIFSFGINQDSAAKDEVYDVVHDEKNSTVYNDIYVKMGEEEENDFIEENENESDTEQEEYYSDDNEEEEEGIKENDENYKPCSEISDVQTFISKINKDYRIILSEIIDQGQLTFICSTKGCLYQANFVLKEECYHLQYVHPHTCKLKPTIEKEQLYEAVKMHEEQEHISNDYMNIICKDLNLPNGSIAYQRIRNAHNKVFHLNRSERIKSWGKLESFLSIIKNNGGYSSIHKNDAGNIDFAGFVPDYSVVFIHSELFFPVVELDTRSQKGISGGRLYCMITMTGNRSILPISIAWAPTESIYYTDMLLKMLENEQSIIKSCQTDEAKPLTISIEKVVIPSILCAWHMSKHCPCKYMFKALVSCSDSHHYAILKDKIQKDYKKLNEYLNTENRWKKITRYEGPQRDQNIATSAVEAFNPLSARLHYKSKEPLQVFKLIYEFGFSVLQKLCYQTGYVTDSAHKYLTFALKVANNLKVSKAKFNLGQYEVSKYNDPDACCTVIILPNKKPKCTCLFYEDCGMVCTHILAVACQNNLNWFSWIHQRYIPRDYKFHFQDMIYPDFNQVIQTNKDRPEGIKSLKQRRKRIPTPGDVKKKKH